MVSNIRKIGTPLKKFMTFFELMIDFFNKILDMHYVINRITNNTIFYNEYKIKYYKQLKKKFIKYTNFI